MTNELIHAIYSDDQAERRGVRVVRVSNPTQTKMG